MDTHHQISVPLALLPPIAWLMQADALFTTTSALLSSLWFLYCFYRAWKDRRP